MGWERGEGEEEGGRDFLNAFVLLLLGFEFLPGCYCCLEVWEGGLVLVVFGGLGIGDQGFGGKGGGDGPVWSFW